MGKFSYQNYSNSDFIPINFNWILARISQEEIFKNVLGTIPEMHVKICSPFRADRNPGCWFEYLESGLLVFRDFGGYDTIIDCFEAVKIKYQLTSISESLTYIRKNYLKEGALIKYIVKGKQLKSNFPKAKVDLFTKYREFSVLDGEYWDPYGIMPYELSEDDVYPVQQYILKTRHKTYNVDATSLSYCVNLPSFSKKLYFPYRKKDKRFLTNCLPEDIGGFGEGDEVVITKSYKDYRVLKNAGYNTRWFQNETTFPSRELLSVYFKSYERITVIFDNDKTGVSSGLNLTHKLMMLFPKATVNALFFPLISGITDASDYYKAFGKKQFNEFLKREYGKQE